MAALIWTPVVLLILVYIVCATASAGVWYVDVDNTGFEDGSEWATAFNTIQEGVDAASDGDEVWVAEGTYIATGSAVVVMETGVDLYGGFAGDETARSERNIVRYPTIIDGEDARRCVRGADDATLNGFTVTRGYAYNGGAMYNYYASPALTNCTFSYNTGRGDGGAGVFNYHASPTLTNCVFTHNTTTGEGEGVWFPNPGMEEVIRLSINKPTGDILASDLLDITELDLSFLNIYTLDGLELCTNLQYLDLRGNHIDDLTPIEGLTALEWLDVGLNLIDDISPLEDLTNLTYLGLGINNIDDLSSIAGLTYLEWLDVSYNLLTDISDIAVLDALTSLDASGNNITDLSTLAGMTTLVELGLAANGIADISDLSGLTNLEWLDLSDNAVDDTTDLSGLTSLEWLNLAQNDITDVTGLVENTGFGPGDAINLLENPLTSAALEDICAFMDDTGVTIYHEGECEAEQGEAYVDWATYVGGTNYDFGSGIAVDTNGNVYTAGYTESSGWSSGGWDTVLNGSDAYVVKLSPTGAHSWSTYVGGTGDETGSGVAVDASGNAYVTGYTTSSGWVSGGWDTTYGGNWDGYVLKLSSAGAHLWSTYLGGTNPEVSMGVTVDASGNAYVTGYTFSSGSVWVSGGWDTSYNGMYDGFTVKLSSVGAHLWSTYLGGTNSDVGIGIAMDSNENAYVTGYTYSSGWVSGGWDTTYGGNKDGYLLKLSPAGAHLWSTYLGGTDDDDCRGVAVASNGDPYLTGYTDSSGWVSGGWMTTYAGGDYDGFTVKLGAAGGHLWSTYLGGTGDDEGMGISVDSRGSSYVTGYTASLGWVSDGWDTSYNGGTYDGFTVKLDLDGVHLWSTYLGGTNDDGGFGMALDSHENAYVAGETHSAGWVSGGWDTILNGVSDGYVMKIVERRPDAFVMECKPPFDPSSVEEVAGAIEGDLGYTIPEGIQYCSLDELDNSRIGIFYFVGHGGVDPNFTVFGRETYLGWDYHFHVEDIPSGLHCKLVFFNCCISALGSGAEAFAEKLDAKVYVGWDCKVSTGEAAAWAPYFFKALTTPGITVQDAKNKAIDAIEDAQRRGVKDLGGVARTAKLHFKIPIGAGVRTDELWP